MKDITQMYYLNVMFKLLNTECVYDERNTWSRFEVPGDINVYCMRKHTTSLHDCKNTRIFLCHSKFSSIKVHQPNTELFCFIVNFSLKS